MKKIVYVSCLFLAGLFFSCGNTKGWEFIAPALPDNFSVDQNKDDLLSYKVDLKGEDVEKVNKQIKEIVEGQGFKLASSWEHKGEKNPGYKLKYFSGAVKQGILEDEGGFGLFTNNTSLYYKEDVALSVPPLQKENDKWYLHLRKEPRPPLDFDMEKTAIEIRKSIFSGTYDLNRYYYKNNEKMMDPGIAGMCKMFEDTYKVVYKEDGTFETSMMLFGEPIASTGVYRLGEDTRSLIQKIVEEEREERPESTYKVTMLSEKGFTIEGVDGESSEWVMEYVKI